jgi:acyl-CoA reductase-like NAD-dependent aldehyde dehydrogenase
LPAAKPDISAAAPENDNMKNILDSLGLGTTNPGTWFGSDSSEDASAPLIESINPANGELIASVRSTTQAEYERLVNLARESFSEWRTVPAPVRGEAVRRIGNALRDHKDALGSLVTLEMGKIKAEGDGEVQEMIDICDFAVGQSRMLYGKTMHSERPQHRMYEQWHPLGVVGTITAFIDLISFTGSSAVGRQVGAQVAKRMGKVLLELGGNNAIIVDEHANMELVVPASVRSAQPASDARPLAASSCTSRGSTN